MRAKKQSAPVVIACLFAATCTAALANNLGASPGSALDPNNYVAPPSTNRLNKTARPAPSSEPAQEETQSTTTFVTMPGFETAEEKSAKIKPAATDSGSGLLSGVNDKFKSAGSGVVSGTKAASDHVVKGASAVGGGIASGAKASGSFFMKGARAIGSGTKKVGSKVAVIPKAIGHGAKAAGDNIKDGTHAVADRLPFTGKSGKGDQPKEVATKPESPELKPDELKLSTPAAAPATVAAAQKPVITRDEKKYILPEAAAEAKMAAKLNGKPANKQPGIVGKTFGTIGKLNVFGHKKNGPTAVLETAGKAPTDADITH